MPGKQLDDEIKRVGDTYYNYVYPPQRAEITFVGSTTVSVVIEGINQTRKNVPVLCPCYTNSEDEWAIDLDIGDTVLVAFINGKRGSPIVVGKY